MTTTQVQSIESTLENIRFPFQPQFDPRKKLADEIESSKRKIWECVDPIDRKRFFAKKKYLKTATSNVAAPGNEENVQQQIATSKEPKHNVGLSEAMKNVGKSPSKSPFKCENAFAQPTTTAIVNNSPVKTKSLTLPKRADIEFKVNAMKVVELKRELKKLGYETGGLKKDLRARLMNVMVADWGEASSKNEKQQTSDNDKSNVVPSFPTVEDSSNKPVDLLHEELQEMDQHVESQFPLDPMKTDEKNPIPERQSIADMSVQQEEEANNVDDRARESISSMEVEHHTSEESVVAKAENKEIPNVVEKSADNNLKPRISSSTLSSSNVSNDYGSPSKTNSKDETTSSNIKEVSSPNVFDFVGSSESSNIFYGSHGNAVPSSAVSVSSSLPSPKCDETFVPGVVAGGKDQEHAARDNSREQKQLQETGSDISQPSSDISTGSISSGKSVKDMVSKFSTFSSSLSNSSSTCGSALSKGLQAKMDARKARNAEMREKAKPVLAKVGLVSKEYNSTILSSTGSTKKQTLAAQMREKAAAKCAMKNETKFTTVSSTALGAKPNILGANSASKSILGSAQKSKLNYQSPPQGLLQQDPLSLTLKKGTPLALAAASSWTKPRVQSPLDTYEISDREDSETDDSESESENSKPKKKIPDWATRPNLMVALEQQYSGKGQQGQRIDPDDIFPEVQSCDLEAIFGNKKSKYRTRNSSGNWTKDRVTVAEKLVYKREMGF